MSNVDQLVKDVVTIKKRISQDYSGSDTDAAVAYLLANRPLIEAAIDTVRHSTTETSRAALHASHRELDQSGIPDGWWSDIPTFALSVASTYYMTGLAPTWDNLHMLERGLRYATHCPGLQRQFTILLSPVKEEG